MLEYLHQLFVMILENGFLNPFKFISFIFDNLALNYDVLFGLFGIFMVGVLWVGAWVVLDHMDKYDSVIENMKEIFVAIFRIYAFYFVIAFPMSVYVFNYDNSDIYSQTPLYIIIGIYILVFALRWAINTSNEKNMKIIL